jgi:hypothetical protein
MTFLARIATLVFQSALGLAGLLFFGDLLHDEVLRPNRSIPLCIAWAGLFILSALVVPGASGPITEKAKTLLVLVKAGRRSTDLKLTEIEIPKVDA